MRSHAVKPEHPPVIPEADALAEAIRGLLQVPDSLAPTWRRGSTSGMTGGASVARHDRP
jgi:hypothetical protein